MHIFKGNANNLILLNFTMNHIAEYDQDCVICKHCCTKKPGLEGGHVFDDLLTTVGVSIYARTCIYVMIETTPPMSLMTGL